MITGTAPRLQLALLHNHGRPAAGVLSLSASGCGMAEALTFGGERINASQWDDAERCRIAGATSDAGPGWQLANGSRSVVCSVNGERVMAQRTRALAVGDVLEVGWLRFAVQAAPAGQSEPETMPEWRMSAGADRQAAPARVAPAMPEFETAPQAAEMERASTDPEDPDAFDLRELASATHEAQFGAVAVTHAQDDPFGVLDIAGAERRPTRDTLAELLGEVPTPDPDRGRGFEALGRQSKADDATAEPQDGPGEPPQAAMAGPRGAQLDHLLDHLHEEFVRVVRDPTQLAGRADWDEAAASGFEAAPSLDELSRQAAPYALLIDILEPREAIDLVIEGFSPLDRASLLDAQGAENEDVLRLFAPALAGHARRAVPSITRREHHGLSPDSYIDIGPSVAMPTPMGQAAGQPAYASDSKEKQA